MLPHSPSIFTLGPNIPKTLKLKIPIKKTKLPIIEAHSSARKSILTRINEQTLSLNKQELCNNAKFSPKSWPVPWQNDNLIFLSIIFYVSIQFQNSPKFSRDL